MPVTLRKPQLLVLVVALLVIICSCTREAPNSISGTVIKIVDGDTLDILDAANVQHRIRLKGIDAPERSQAFYQVSRENLATLTFQKEVRADYEKIDRYGRPVGTVWVAGNDACLAQIKVGLAWHFKRYQKEQSQSDREEYDKAERDASSHKLGLWRDSNPTPPWDFRRHKTGSDEEPNADIDSPSLLHHFNGPAASNRGSRNAQPIANQNSLDHAKRLNGPVTSANELGFIRGNKRSRIYHWRGCPNYDEIGRHNRVLFRTGEDAVKAGYRAARNCN